MLPRIGFFVVVVGSGCGRVGYQPEPLQPLILTDAASPADASGDRDGGANDPFDADAGHEGSPSDGAVVDASFADPLDAPVPLPIFATTRAAAASPGDRGHGCALVDDMVRCWGWNLYAQLGQDAELLQEERPAVVDGVRDVVSVHAGRNFTCVLSDGAAWCWGETEDGALGRGVPAPCVLPCRDATPAEVLDPSGAAPLSRVSVLTAGGGVSGFACAVADGAAYCWGANALGQLGDGTRQDRFVATPVALPGTATDIAAGDNHACAIDSAGDVWCWGDPDAGALGIDTTELVLFPARVPGVSGAVRLALGTQHSCALVDDGTVSCWGANLDGQLGDATRTSRATPRTVPGLPAPVTDVSAGGPHDHTPAGHTCAVAAGSLYCWGRNAAGQVGTTGGDRTSPFLVPGLPASVDQVEAGGNFTCAVLADASTWCWGDNTYGQLGDGTTDSRSTPAPVLP